MKKTRYPKVSLIMATCNRAGMIGESLRSISDQSFSEWECLIIDDGSADDTRGVVKAISLYDSRFQYVQRGKKYRKGLPGARNHGLDLARGKFILFVDDDDILHPESLKTAVSILRNNESSFCRFDKQPFIGDWKAGYLSEVRDFKEKIFNLENLDEMITGELPFASCTVLWRSHCFKDVRFDEKLSYAEEWECYTRILVEGFSGTSINQVLYYNRKHPKSNTGEFSENNLERKISYIIAALKIITILHENNLFTEKLKSFFIKLGFYLRSGSIIKTTLSAVDAGRMEMLKYFIGFKFYFLLRPIFILKAKIVKF